MTDEEKQAIENLRKILFTTMQANECGLSNNDFKKEIKTYTDILGLIEKQQAEINALQMEHNHDVKMIDEVKGEAVRLYKIIDEMIYYLSDFDIDEMCEQCECCIGNGCHADDDVEFKMRCIKEYFKKKVEDK